MRHAPPGRYGDGYGLRLLVRSADEAYWSFRYRFGGKDPEKGLGPARGRAALSLSEARAEAVRLWQMVKGGIDPLAGKQTKAVPPAMTFAAVAELYIAAHRAGWKGDASETQWRQSLADYVFPVMGPLDVALIGTGEVMRAIEPHWANKAETMRRVRARIEAVLDYAAARGWRSGDNPARWRGHIENLLPKVKKIAPVQHHAAMPWRDISGFMDRLAGQVAMSALALRFQIATVARPGEALGARWSEVDLDAAVWTIPPSRMKSGREHRVPLTEVALDVLRSLEPLRSRDGHVFPGPRSGGALGETAFKKLLDRLGAGVTAHGFRSTFRDWCGDVGEDRTVAELCLAHAAGNRTEQAYARSDLLERRRALLGKWARHCTGPATEAAVVPIRGAA